MKRRSNRTVLVLSLLCSLPAAVPPARAGVDVDFGANVRAGDDANVFFSVSSRYFDRDRAVVETWGRRVPNPDDLSVLLFLSTRSGKPPEAVWALRRQGLSWFRIAGRIGVPVDAFFVPVERDPGPPYGHAYGYWKKHQANPRAAVVLTDVDVRNLVAVRVVHEYYGVSPEVAMRWRSSGSSVRTIVAREYRERHFKGHKAQDARGDDHADKHGKPGDRGKDKNKGHDKDKR